MRLPASDRACDAAETYDRVAPYFASFGITRIARHTGLDRIGIPVWCAYTPNATSIVVAQGKGATDEDARTSAAMEALERAVACAPDAVAISASRADLARQGRSCHPMDALIAAGQDPIGNAEDMLWTEGRDLLSGQDILVPWQAVILDRTLDRPRYWQSSDGLASGNTPEEAVFHGLMERVERDAQVLWQLRPARARLASCLDISAFRCAAIDAMRDRIVTAGLTLRLFDMTSDLGIPCYSAYLGPGADRLAGRLRYVDVTYGAGAHLEPRRAALRAISEAAQSRLTYISGARDDVFAADYERPLPDTTREALMAQPTATVDADGPVCAPDRLLALLEEKGAGPLIAVSLARPDLPFAVVKVLAPRLENPEGRRRMRFGARALAQALAS